MDGKITVWKEWMGLENDSEKRNRINVIHAHLTIETALDIKQDQEKILKTSKGLEKIEAVK